MIRGNSGPGEGRRRYLKAAQKHYVSSRKGLDDLATADMDDGPLRPEFVVRTLDQLASQDASGKVTLTVFGKNNAGNGPSSSSTFTVISPPTTPPTPVVKPSITVNYKSGFVVTGSHFSPNKRVTIRVVDDGDPAHYLDYYQTSDSKGDFTTTLSITCNAGYNLHFSATDLRPDSTDLTGDLWSNTVTIACP